MWPPELILRESLQRLGWPGRAGAAALLAALVYGLGGILPAAQQHAQVRAALAQAEQGRPGAQAGAPFDAPTDQQRHQALLQALTAQDAVGAAIERLYAAAAAERISLERGEYVQAPVAHTRLVRYQIVLPLQADYGQIQRFVQVATASVAGLHLGDISLQRKSIGETQLEARLQFFLYLARP